MNLNRQWYRAGLVLTFLGVNLAILFGIASVWSYLNTGADRTSMFHTARELEQNYRPSVVWDTTTHKGRAIFLQSLKDIEKDYLQAWNARYVAYATYDQRGISDYYTKNAQAKIDSAISLNQHQKIRVRGTTLAHHPKLEFYSADGKIVVLTDHKVSIFEEIYRDSKLLSKQERTATFKVVMLLEDGFWRIRHLVEAPSNTTTPATKTVQSVDHIRQVKGINYYPQQTPWNTFGAQFSTTAIRSDFTEIKKLGLNTVRVFIPYTSKQNDVHPESQYKRVKQLLDLAEQQQLKVLITLFDFYGNYDLTDWTLSHRHAQEIVERFKNHEALLAWDLKNEPDLDFEAREKERVLDWLKQLAKQVKKWDPNHPITIGWSSMDAAEELVDIVDFVSFHFYEEPSRFDRSFAQLQKKAKSKPLMLQEFGHSSYRGFWNLYGGSEEQQSTYIKEVLSRENVPYLLWTLHDFTTIPDKVVGTRPWRKATQKNFGLLDEKGNPKKVYELFITKKKRE